MTDKLLHGLTEQERNKRIRTLSQKLTTAWITYELLEVAETTHSTGLSIVDELVEQLRRVEYESIQLGDRVEITGKQIGKVIRVWRYNDDNGSYYNFRLDGDTRTLAEDGGVYFNFNNYLEIVSRYNSKED